MNNKKRFSRVLGENIQNLTKQDYFSIQNIPNSKPDLKNISDINPQKNLIAYTKLENLQEIRKKILTNFNKNKINIDNENENNCSNFESKIKKYEEDIQILKENNDKLEKENEKLRVENDDLFLSKQDLFDENINLMDDAKLLNEKIEKISIEFENSKIKLTNEIEILNKKHENNKEISNEKFSLVNHQNF